MAPRRRPPGLAILILVGLLVAPPESLFARPSPSCPTPRPVPLGASSRLDWRAEPGLERMAESLARGEPALAPFPGIGGPQRWLGDRPTVYLLRDLACLEPLGLGEARPDWVAGVASESGPSIALRVDPSRAAVPAVRAVLRHELAHLALARATGGNAPLWLHEGYAQLAAGDWDWREAWRLRFVLLARGGDLLSGLSLRFPADPEQARLAYLLSYTAVWELARAGGSGGLEALFGALRAGNTLDGALRTIFGMTEAQFERRWSARVARRYGVLYLLSRATVFWVFLTVVLLWFGRRRKRRDRERMRILKQAEARAEEDAAADAVDGSPAGL
ncbi:MAG: peptidase MA family metallohydrolase [Gemmatimonadota bacterium]